MTPSDGKEGRRGAHSSSFLLAIWLASLPYAQRFADPRLPCSDDGLPHLLRAVQFDLNLKGGAPFLQWWPDLLHGYGYPVFLFYAPLTTWWLEGLHLLGLDFAPALRLAYYAALLIAGWGAGLLVREHFGEIGGIVGGMAYLYSPYLAFDAVQRGALPELTALAIAPWVLWAVAKSQKAKDQTPKASARWFAAASVLLAADILAHNMIPLLLMPFVVGYSVALSLAAPGRAWLRSRLASASLATVAILAVALVLTLFFWLPAQQELRFVQTWRGLVVHQQDYRNNLLPLDHWATLPPLPVDLHLVNPPTVRTMGIAQLAASLAALITFPRQKREQPPLLLFFALLFGFFFFLTTDVSRPVWDALPPLQLFQLPTRFLGLAGLGTAGLTGALAGRLGAASTPKHKATEENKPVASLRLRVLALYVGAPLFTLACLLNTLPWLYALTCPTPTKPGAREIAAATELPLRTTAEGSLEFLPIWVGEIPDTTSFANEYAAGRAPERLDTTRALMAVQVERVSSVPGAEAWKVNAAAPWQAIYRTFYFPGWQATLDGRPTPIEIAEPNGLMAVNVPAGTHTLTFEFHRTPIRVWTLVISGLAWAVLIAWSTASGRWRATGDEPRTGNSYHVSRPTPHALRSMPYAFAILFLVLFLFKLLYLDRFDNPLRADRLASGQLSRVAHPTAIDFGAELRHLGYDLSRERVPSGGEVRVIQYWTALTDIGVPYGMEVRLADDEGFVWSALPPRRPFGFVDYPGTESWKIGEYARDAFVLEVLPGTPPGTYWLEANAFRRDVVSALLPLNAARGPNPAFARIGRIEIAPGRGAPPTETWRVAHTGRLTLADWLTLKGWTLTPAEAQVGEYLYLDLLWNAPIPPGRSAGSTIEARLESASGAVVLSTPISLAQNYPPARWPGGIWIRTQARILLPARLLPGRYRLSLWAGATPAALGSVVVRVPARAFEPPALAHAVGIPFGDFAGLRGFETSAARLTPGEMLTVRLVWQAVTETAVNYRVFVHLQANDGSVVAQSDGAPANWTRPTTGWLSGEYVLDEHVVALPDELPAGKYGLVVGMYDPATGRRVKAANGDDSVKIAEIEIVR